MDTKQEHHVKDIMKHFDTAMLITHLPNDRSHARPMRIAEVGKDGVVRFATSKNSPKIKEITKDHSVHLVFQSSSVFLSLIGKAKIEDDPKLVKRLWSEPWRVWFPKGEDDPSICIIAVTPDEAEFWDNSGMEGISYAFKAATAYVQGKKPAIDPSIHGKVAL